MALTSNDAKILQEIVDLDGDCMLSTRCKLCPFRGMCLPEFLNIPPTQEQRAKMALDVMTHHALVDESEELDIEQHRWDKR